MKTRNSYRSRLGIVLLLFFAAAFLLPALRTGDTRLYILAAAVPCGILLLLLLPVGFFSLDRPSVAAALTLCGLGILAPASVFPDEAFSQGLRTAAALFFLMGGAVLVRTCRISFPVGVVTAFCALTMLALPLLLSSSVSLTEAGMALLMFSVAVFFTLRQRLSALIVVLAGLLLLLRNDLCAAAVWTVTAVLLFWSSSGSSLWTVLCLLASGGLIAVFSLLSPMEMPPVQENLLARVASMPLIPPESSVAAGSVSVDSLFLLLGEQYGLVFPLCALVLLCILLLSGASLALHTRKAFHAALALGAVLLTGLQALSFLLSMLDLLPFGAVAFPLMTADIPQLCGEFFLLGILSGVSARNEADLSEDVRLSMLAR